MMEEWNRFKNSSKIYSRSHLEKISHFGYIMENKDIFNRAECIDNILKESYDLFYKDKESLMSHIDVIESKYQQRKTDTKSLSHIGLFIDYFRRLLRCVSDDDLKSTLSALKNPGV